jgi:hypothetical protein
MARSRKYEDNAHRQAAYRRRQQEVLRAQREAKGLPALPPIPMMPGWKRWNQAMRHAESLVTLIQTEMESDYDDRSETWQESDRADEFQQKLEDVTGVLEAMTDWLA